MPPSCHKKWILFLAFVGLSFGARADLTSDMSSVNQDLLTQTAILHQQQGQLAEINDKLTKCRPVKGWGEGTQMCPGLFGLDSNYFKEDLEAMHKNAADLKKKVSATQARVDQLSLEKKMGSVTPADRAALGNLSLRSDMLMLKTEVFQGQIKQAKTDMDHVRAELDKSVLGDYSKYVADNAINNAGPQICKMVSTCDSVSKMQTSQKNMNAKIQGFSAWLNANRSKIDAMESSQGSATGATK